MKKILSLLLGICLIVSIIPLASSAEDLTPRLDVTVETPVAGQAPSYEDTYSLADARYDALVVSGIKWFYARTDATFNGDTDRNWAPMSSNDTFKADCFYAYAITFGNVYPNIYDLHAWKNLSTINGGTCGFAYDTVNQLFTLYIKLGQPEAPDIPDSTVSPSPSASPTTEPTVQPEPTAKPPVEPTAKPTPKPIFLSFTLDGYKVDANIVNGLTVSSDEDTNEGIELDSWAITKVLSSKDSFHDDIITDESAKLEPVTDYYLAVQFLLDDGYDISRYTAENITLEGYGTAAALFENGNNGYTAMFRLPKLYRDVSELHFTLDGYEIGEAVADTTMTNDLNNEGIAWGENLYLSHFSISDSEITFDNYEDNIIDDKDYVFEKDTDYYLCLTLPSIYGYTAENLTAENITLDGYGTASSVEYIDESDEEEGVNGFVAFFKLPQLKEATPEPSVTPEPTAEPTNTPEPTVEPTTEPTSTPEPTVEPTAEPTSTPEPTAEPTVEPTATPTAAPTATPERSVIVTPTPTPTQSPTPELTEVPNGNGGGSGTSGEKSTTVVTASASPATTPATGDNSNMGIWYAVLAVSALGIVGTSLIAKAKKK